jgi:hypothetical protein
MQELLKKLTEEVGLSADQASKTMHTVVDFVKTKLPASLSATVDNIFTGKMDSAAAMNAAAEPSMADKAKDLAHDAKDKITDMAEDAKEKLSNLADEAKEKFAAFTESENIEALKDKAEAKLDDLKDKAEDLAEGALDKLKGLFGGKKD